MEKEKIKEWLDVVSNACNILIGNSNFENIVFSISCIREIHLFISAEELRYIANAVDATVGVWEHYTAKYPYQYYFIYNGIKFLCLSKERLEDAGTD